jgi:hypothetical protein
LAVRGWWVGAPPRRTTSKRLNFGEKDETEPINLNYAVVVTGQERLGTSMYYMYAFEVVCSDMLARYAGGLFSSAEMLFVLSLFVLYSTIGKYAVVVCLLIVHEQSRTDFYA